jgi:hypothetical protein
MAMQNQQSTRLILPKPLTDINSIDNQNHEFMDINSDKIAQPQALINWPWDDVWRYFTEQIAEMQRIQLAVDTYRAAYLSGDREKCAQALDYLGQAFYDAGVHMQDGGMFYSNPEEPLPLNSDNSETAEQLWEAARQVREDGIPLPVPPNLPQS